MKTSKPSDSRKPPALSAEEELAELLSDPTLRPSLNFLGIKEASNSKIRYRMDTGTDSVPDTKSVPDINSSHQALFNNDTGSESVSGTKSVGETPDLVRLHKRPLPKRASLVEDGHSHAEQSLYEVLWKRAKPYQPDARVITIGFGTMSGIVRLSLNNCRQNIRCLIRKLAVQELRAEQSRQKIGKTYLIYSPQAVLQRRKAAGLEWVVRTKGVAFVDKQTGVIIAGKTAVARA